MKCVSPGNLMDLGSTPNLIRNICILAHVDHGKTTLADGLIASNGLISDRMIGKMRYMDNLPEEQERGITVKSSSIALSYDFDGSPHLINLIDSPGHVDFCGEVSTATRLCDGALIVVDCIEGVCPQTITSLRHAWFEGLKPLLVLNKIDRLILELKLSPSEIYKHLRRLLERINAVAGEYFTSKMMELDERVPSTSTQNIQNGRTNGAQKNGENFAEIFMENDVEKFDLNEQTLYFDPAVGNVIFASAYDGWAFRIGDFAKIWSEKAQISANVLNKTLWGDFYLDEKAKRVRLGAESKGKKPLFVKLIMENLWSAYDSVIVQNDRTLAEKIVANFKLRINQRDASHRDPKIFVRAVLQQWLPLGDAVLRAVCAELPPPAPLSSDKVKLLLSVTASNSDLLPFWQNHLLNAGSQEPCSTLNATLSLSIRKNQK